jgi:hypothetical protein
MDLDQQPTNGIGRTGAQNPFLPLMSAWIAVATETNEISASQPTWVASWRFCPN